MANVREIKVVRVLKQVVFDCGCICERPIVGEFSHIREWHVLNCIDHAGNGNRKILEERAEEEFNRALIRSS